MLSVAPSNSSLKFSLLQKKIINLAMWQKMNREFYYFGLTTKASEVGVYSMCV